MANLIISNEAEDDIKEIVGYIANDDIDAALRFYGRSLIVSSYLRTTSMQEETGRN